MMKQSNLRYGTLKELVNELSTHCFEDEHKFPLFRRPLFITREDIPEKKEDTELKEIYEALLENVNA